MLSSREEIPPAKNQFRNVTVLVLAESGGAEPESFLSQLRKTAGAGFDSEIVAHPHDSRALNKAIRLHPQNDIVLINSLLHIQTAEWLLKFQARAAENPDAGILGAKIFDRLGLIYSCGRLIVSRLGLNEHLANIGHGETDAEKASRFIEADAVLPWLCFIRREAYDKAGGFDERWTAVPPGPGRPPWLEFDDFCLSVRAAGFSVGVDSAIEGTHPQARLDARFEALYQKLEVPPLDIFDSRFINLWRKKWRWHPSHPDLSQVRERWLDTPVCWRIGKRLLDQWTTQEPLVDLLLITRNNLSLLRSTLSCLSQTTYRPFQLWIHINGSTDGTLDYLQEFAKDSPFPLKLVHTPVNLGYTPAFNWLLQLSDAPLVAKLDDDIELSSDWLSRLVERLRSHAYAGAVGTKVVDAAHPHHIQWADYHVLPRLTTHDGEADHGQFDYLSRTVGNMGCCLLYRRRAIDVAGPLDIALNPISWDDLDHQIALWVAGYDVLYDGQVKVKHPSKPLRDHCRKAMKNTCGNGFKVQIKWGPGALALLEMSIDSNRRLD